MNEWKSKADYRDPTWKYVKEDETDIRKTFRRVEREIQQLLKGKEPRRIRVNPEQQSA